MANTVRIRNGMTNATEGDILGNASDIVKDLGVVDKAGGHLLVTENTPKGMSVQVAGGIVYVPNANYNPLDSDTPKFYPVVCSAEVLTIDNNTSGSTRHDIVCVKVDKVIIPDADADNIATKVVIKGSPGGGVPATPANHYKLAEITVINGETEIENSMITDKRGQVFLNGKFIVPSGVVVGTTDEQTLTHKTLTSPTITTPTIDGVRPMISICHLYQNPGSSGQTITNNAETRISFETGTELYDPLDWHSTSTNPTRITIEQTGLYYIYGHIILLTNDSTATARTVNIAKSGAICLSSRVSPDGSGRFASYVGGVLSLSEGDYIELLVYYVGSASNKASSSGLGIMKI